MAGEFDLIANYFNWPTDSASVKVGVGDDAAVLALTPAHELVISVDTLVSGVHYPFDTSPQDIGYKSLIVNLSDIAAMGAEPRWFTLALTLPEYDVAWLEGFSFGLKQAATEYGVALIGGDTTRGSNTISIQIMGEVAAGQALKRSAAKLGDDLYITNTTGDAAAGLRIHQENQIDNKNSTPNAPRKKLSGPEQYCVSRLNRPTARVAESRVLCGYANACMDISDGLLQDLSHILKASRLGAVIDTSTLTVSKQLSSLYARERALAFALSGGDDYELLFSVPKHHQTQFTKAMQKNNMSFQRIGELTNDVDEIHDEQGNLLSADGFKHF